MVVVAESSKSLLFDLGGGVEQRDEQVENNLITIQTSRRRPTNKVHLCQHLRPKTMLTRECNQV